MQGQQPNKPVKLIPMSEPAKPVQLQPMQQSNIKKKSKKRKKKDKLTRIEKYNVAELCWKYYLNLSREPEDIVMLLNNHLTNKRDALLRAGKIQDKFHFPKLTKMDVRVFLETQQERIDKYLGGERKKMMEASFDSIKKIQELAIETEETMRMWRAKLEDALNKNDDKKLRMASKMLKDERESLHRLSKDIAQLMGKVKTYISIDMMYSQVMSIADIIEQAEEIDEDTKIHLIKQISTTLDVEAKVV